MPFNHQSLNMKVCHTLICCFFLSLQGGNNGLANAQTSVYIETEGGDVTIECFSSLPGIRKIFCKEPCKQEDILIETTDVRAQRDRYSIEWKKKQGTALGDVSVTITQLTKSDSGRYWCGRSSITFKQIEIIVVDALLDEDTSGEKTLYKRTGGNIIVECSFTSSQSRAYFCKEDCEEKDILVKTFGYTGQADRYSIRYVEGTPSGGFVYVGITQLTKSDSGRYSCGLERPFSQDSYLEFEIIVTDAPTTSKLNLNLLVFSSSVPSTSTATSSSSESFTTPHDKAKPSAGVLTYVVPIVVIIVIIVIISGLALMVICIRKKTKPDGLITRGNTDGINMEIALYENCRPVSTFEESNYQTLDPASMDQDQTYSTLTPTQHT